MPLLSVKVEVTPGRKYRELVHASCYCPPLLCVQLAPSSTAPLSSTKIMGENREHLVWLFNYQFFWIG